MKKPKVETTIFNEKSLQKDLLHNAKVVGLSAGAAAVIVEKVVPKVAERMAKRAVVTADDYSRFITQEVEKYSKDLAYVYKNRGKII